MDIQSGIENEKFLYLCGSPYKSMCKILTLKSGVLIIGILDVIIGIYYIIILALELPSILLYIFVYPIVLTLILQRGLGVVAMWYAIKGIRATSKLATNDFKVYSNFKTFELIAQGFLKLVIIFIISRYSTGFNSNLYFFLTCLGIERLIALVLAKVVWSANMRVRYNEIVLVQHGEEVARCIEMQSNSLANPQVIVPGINAYFAAPYSG